MIYGERIRFRGAEREDIPMFVNWFNDPEVREGLALYLPMSKASEEIWFDNMIKRPPDEQVLIIEVQDDQDWKAIGTVGLFAFSRNARAAELGISIGEKTEWNKGYGTEAMKLLLKHSFETLNLNRLCLKVYSYNHKAIRCYEKAGFVHEGCNRQAVFHNGEYFDVLWMSVLRSEWKTEDIE